MEYVAITKERTTERKCILVVGGFVLMYLSYEIHNWLYFILAALMTLAVFYQKKHIVNETGVHIRYTLLGVIRINDSWKWDEVTAVAPDYKKMAPEVLVEFNKGLTIRGFKFKKRDALEVLEFAQEMNPDMYVDTRTEEERESATAELAARQKREYYQQQAERRAKAQQKKKKKKK